MCVHACVCWVQAVKWCFLLALVYNSVGGTNQLLGQWNAELVCSRKGHPRLGRSLHNVPKCSAAVELELGSGRFACGRKGHPWCKVHCMNAGVSTL